MPAATLWSGDCSSLPQTYFYNVNETYPGDFDIADVNSRLHPGLPYTVDSVTLRPGYNISLYPQGGFKGEPQVFQGAY